MSQLSGKAVSAQDYLPYSHVPFSHRKSPVSWAVIVEFLPNRWKEILPLQSALECFIQFWTTLYMRGMERVQQRATEVMSELQHLSSGRHPRELGLFSPGERRLRGDLSMCINS